jgi:hypothetical protein
MMFFAAQNYGSHKVATSEFVHLIKQTIVA